MTAIDVQDNEAKHRFEAVVDGDVAGYAEYRRDGGTIVFTHTVVEPQFEGKGIGGRLASGALDSAVGDQLAIAPECSFIAGYIKKHPEYVQHVDPQFRSRVE